jgi:hypothetical protein
LQRGIQRLGLGARAAARRDDGLERRPKPLRRNRVARFAVVGFDDELDVELFRRIVRYYGANATSTLLMLPLSLRHG